MYCIRLSGLAALREKYLAKLLRRKEYPAPWRKLCEPSVYSLNTSLMHSFAENSNYMIVA
jgi:hypothetical protein